MFILHSNSDGKICLDVLQMPPGGSYNPAITLESILLSIQLLLASPNPDDPLRNEVSDEYKYNRDLFNENAKKYSGNKQEINQNVIDEAKSMDEDKGETVNEDNGADADQNETLTADNGENVEIIKETVPTTSTAKVCRKRKHEDAD